MNSKYLGNLHEMTMTTPTQYWNDSCSVEELTYAIERGATGATSNPTIVLGVLKKEMYLWEDHIKKTIRENPTWSEIEVAWKVFEDVTVHGSNFSFRYSSGKTEKEAGYPSRLTRLFIEIPKPCLNKHSTSTALLPICRSKFLQPRPELI